MHTNFYNHITKYFDLIDNKKILILNDPYYSFSATKININIEKKIDKLINNKNIKLVNKAEEFLKLTEKFEIIINIFFSATFINQIKYSMVLIRLLDYQKNGIWDIKKLKLGIFT